MNTNRLNNIVSRQRTNRASDLAFAILVAAILAILAVAMWQVRDVVWVSETIQAAPSLSQSLAPADCLEISGEEIAALSDRVHQC